VRTKPAAPPKPKAAAADVAVRDTPGEDPR
jgi:hypothetical protein